MAMASQNHSNLSLSLIGFTITILASTLILVVSANNRNNTDNLNNSFPSFTAKEISALKQFREIVTPYLYQDFMKHDQYLIRWIRDSDFNLQAAKTKLIQMIKWRKDNQIDTILEEDFSLFQKTCPYSVDGIDKNGRPLITMAFGKCDIRKLVLFGNVEKFERFMIYVLENGAQAVRELIKFGANIKDAIIIADFNGFNLRQHGCVRCIPALFSLLNYYQSYYPDYLCKMFFINIPRVAIPIIDDILPVLSPTLKETFKPFGFDRREWETEIRKYVDPAQLTFQFGGNKKLKT